MGAVAGNLHGRAAAGMTGRRGRVISSRAMTDASNPPGSRRPMPSEPDEDSGETVTISRYTPAAMPVLPFGGAAPPSAPAPVGEAPPPVYPVAPPPAAPPAWSGQPAAPSAPGAAASPWSTRAPMPRALTPTPAVAPPAAPQHGALEASHAAAAASAPWSAPRAAAPPAVVAAPEPVAAPGAGREVVQLLWLDEAAAPRIRRVPAFRPILAALDAGPLDRDLDDPTGELDPMLVDDRRAVFEIAALGRATDAPGVLAALEGGIRADGKLVPPVVLVAGELATPFDELAQLQATIAVATPLATADDPELQAALAMAQRFLASRGTAGARPMARSLSIRIREAFGREKKLLLGHLDEHVQRTLREERSFQRRDVLGEPHLRLLLHVSDDAAEAPLVVYAPVAVAAKLPMFARFPARLLADVHLPEDESEAGPVALRALALVRRASVPRSG
jgi:hypothetical protein